MKINMMPAAPVCVNTENPAAIERWVPSTSRRPGGWETIAVPERVGALWIAKALRLCAQGWERNAQK